MSRRVLIVDDETLVCKSLGEMVRQLGYESHAVNNGYEALEVIQKNQFSAVVTDMKMPGMNGLELLKRTKEILPNIAVIIITGYASVDYAVEVMKNGATDYIPKPFTYNRIKSVLESAIEPYFKKDKIAYSKPDTNFPSFRFITSDSQMLDVLDKVKLIAGTNSTVLIQGETGTGKELIARAIHEYSKRSQNPYVAFNCAALPESLIESELFGHEKGAFTGAITRKIGKFEMAHKGTILFDEVSEMAITLQAKLLRVIQNREINRLGGNESIQVDTRIIATTNKDLSTEVDNGKFREDLFYRLCVVPLFLPSLRERKDDIPILIQYFIQKFCRQMGKKDMEISCEAMESLMKHSWPGNVRELENTIERAVALSQNGQLLPNHLFIGSRKEQSKHIFIKIGTSLQDAEKEIITKTLKEMEGNKQKTAEILGITSKTIRSKIKQ